MEKIAHLQQAIADRAHQIQRHERERDKAKMHRHVMAEERFTRLIDALTNLNKADQEHLDREVQLAQARDNGTVICCKEDLDRAIERRKSVPASQKEETLA